MDKPEGIFSKGNFKSGREFQKTIRGMVNDKAKSDTISGALNRKTFEPSGLSRDEALQGLKALKAEGKLTQKEIDQLKKKF